MKNLFSFGCRCFIFFAGLIWAGSPVLLFGQTNVEEAEESWTVPAHSAPPTLCLAKIDGDKFIYRKLVPYTSESEVIEYVDVIVIREENGREIKQTEKRPTRRTVAVTKYFSEEFSCPLEQVQFSRVDSPGKLMSLEESRIYFDGNRGHFERALMLTGSNAVEIQHAGFFKFDLVAFRIRDQAQGEQNQAEGKLK